MAILVRGLELLAPGGLLAYSTCSLNPIGMCSGSPHLIGQQTQLSLTRLATYTEDEAVVSAALAQLGGLDCFEIVAPPPMDGLGMHPGLAAWGVPHPDGPVCNPCPSHSISLQIYGNTLMAHTRRWMQTLASSTMRPLTMCPRPSAGLLVSPGTSSAACRLSLKTLRSYAAASFGAACSRLLPRRALALRWSIAAESYRRQQLTGADSLWLCCAKKSCSRGRRAQSASTRATPSLSQSMHPCLAVHAAKCKNTIYVRSA